MKYFKAVLKYAAIAYALGSLALSVAATAFGQYGEGSLIEHRAPFLVLDFFTGTVAETDPDGCQFGYTASGELIGYGRAEYPEGTQVLTLCGYNPLTNWFDDISARFDLLTWQ